MFIYTVVTVTSNKCISFSGLIHMYQPHDAMTNEIHTVAAIKKRKSSTSNSNIQLDPLILLSQSGRPLEVTEKGL